MDVHKALLKFYMDNHDEDGFVEQWKSGEDNGLNEHLVGEEDQMYHDHLLLARRLVKSEWDVKEEL